MARELILYFKDDEIVHDKMMGMVGQPVLCNGVEIGEITDVDEEASDKLKFTFHWEDGIEVVLSLRSKKGHKWTMEP